MIKTIDFYRLGSEIQLLLWTGLKAKQSNPSAAVSQTGITPVLEKTFEVGITAAGKKKGSGGTAGHKAAGSEKRPVSPNAKQKGNVFFFTLI